MARDIDSINLPKTRPGPASDRECPECGAKYGSLAEFCQADGTRLLAMTEGDELLGQVLLEQFTLLSELGRGGMGTVYRARQLGVGRDVAIKVLDRELSDHEESAQRFRREATIAATLDHPNIVRVLLTAELPDGRPYIVMEFLDGQPLSELLNVTPLLPLPRAMHLLTQICDAIGEAHAQGIIHRDIKPENVVVVRRGQTPDFVKVLDFGIAKSFRGGPVVTQQSGLVFGTAKYISPEGAAGETCTPASDVYALGVVGYQLLAGQLPFEANSPVGYLMKHVQEQPRPLHVVAPHAPTALCDLIMRCLSKTPGARPRDASELAHLLRATAAQVGLASTATLIPSTMPGAATLMGSTGTGSGSMGSPVHGLGLHGAVDSTMGTAPGSPMAIRQAVEPTLPLRTHTSWFVGLAFVLGAGAVLSGAYVMQQRESPPKVNVFEAPRTQPPRSEIATPDARPKLSLLPEAPVTRRPVSVVLRAPRLAADPLLEVRRDGRRVFRSVRLLPHEDGYLAAVTFRRAGDYTLIAKGASGETLAQVDVAVASNGRRNPGTRSRVVRERVQNRPTLTTADQGIEWGLPDEPAPATSRGHSTHADDDVTAGSPLPNAPAPTPSSPEGSSFSSAQPAVDVPEPEVAPPANAQPPEPPRPAEATDGPGSGATEQPEPSPPAAPPPWRGNADLQDARHGQGGTDTSGTLL